MSHWTALYSLSIIFATPVQLHEKIQKMNDRARDLEAALQRAQSCVSADIHPLLGRTEQEDTAAKQISHSKPEKPQSGSEGDQGVLPVEAPSAGVEMTPEGTSSTDTLFRVFGTLKITTGRGSRVGMNSTT